MKRKTTRLIPFYRGKCLPVALMTLALASANVALAQTNPWVGEALPAEGGDFICLTKRETVFCWVPIHGVRKVLWDNLGWRVPWLFRMVSTKS